MLIRRRGLVTGAAALAQFAALRPAQAITPHSKKLLLEEKRTYTGPGDLAPGAAGAYMLSGYSARTSNTTQCVNLRRSSDSATSDFGLSNGNLHQGAIAAWGGINATGTGAITGTTLTFTGGVIGGQVTGPGVAAGTVIVSGTTPTWTVNISQTVASATLQVANALFVVTVYDQSGNNRNATQATTANQPYLALYALAGRAAIAFLTNGALNLAVSSITNIWAAGGWALSALNVVAVQPGQLDRPWVFGSNAPEFGVAGSQKIELLQASSTSNGTWISTPTITLVSHVLDVSYSQSSVANVPIMTVDGGAVAFASVQPVGSLTTGTSVTLGAIVNGLGCLQGAWLFYPIPSVGAQEAVRKNLGAYYGIPVS